jgi:hypothetical protein
MIPVCAEVEKNLRNAARLSDIKRLFPFTAQRREAGCAIYPEPLKNKRKISGV